MQDLSPLIHTICEIDPSVSVFTTGQKPKTFMDLLVIGGGTRSNYFGRLSQDRRIQDSHTEQSGDALMIRSETGHQIGVAYHRYRDFLEHTEGLMSGELLDPVVTSWSLGPWLPETYASDLSRAINVQKGDVDLAQRIKSFRIYPPALAIHVVKRCVQEIDRKSKMIKNEQDPSSLAYSFMAADICLAGIRIIHAREKIYFRGLKYIAHTKLSLSLESIHLVDVLCSIDNYTQALELLE